MDIKTTNQMQEHFYPSLVEIGHVVLEVWFGFMVYNATFNNISAISWWSVLLVKETGFPGENCKFYLLVQ